MSSGLYLYTDGGTVGKNPSPHGGTWAWRYVEHICCDGILYGNQCYKELKHDSGILTPYGDSMEGRLVTNNITEFYAMLRALESMNDGWEGKVCSDSLITLGRFFVMESVGWKRRAYLKNIPLMWIPRMERTLQRLSPRIQPVLLSGHPTKQELNLGVGKRGTPVSIHNKWCDEECTRLVIKFSKENNVPDSRAGKRIKWMTKSGRK